VDSEITTAYVGLGSNLGDRSGNLLYAVRGLLEASFSVNKLSAIYETEPVGLEDSQNGDIATSRNSAQAAIDNQNRRIADEQDRIDILQKSLIARMAAADALIASLEQQVSYFNTLFASMNGTKN